VPDAEGRLAVKSLGEVRRIKTLAESSLLKLPGVTGIGIGNKITRGKKTEQLAIQVFVKRKDPDIRPGDCVPTEIDGVPTDVIERTFVLHSSK
jgi:hypothetical protein